MASIVFDMDGVLFDTERLCMESWIAVAGRYGICDMETFFPKCIGFNAADSRTLMFETYGADFPYDRFRQEASAWFQESVQKNGLPLKKGVREILDWLRQNEWKIALASSTNQRSVMSHLELSGLKEYFSVIITGNMVEHSKPEPDIYRMACEGLGVNPADTYAIEDSPKGIVSAYRAGMIPIMVPDLIAADEEMERLSRRIFTDLAEVHAFLRSQSASAP